MPTNSRVADLYQILQDGNAGRAFHPEYAAIKDAERRFIDEAITDYADRTGHLPTTLRYPRPRTDIEDIVQAVALQALQKNVRRPVAIHYTTPPIKPPQRLRHAWRLTRRIVLTRRSIAFTGISA